MNMNEISGIAANFTIAPAFSNPEPEKASNLFDEAYEAALTLFNETSDYQKKADQIQMDYVTGKTDDSLALIMAQNRASTTLNFTMQIASKALQAYQEIMRMQL